MADLKEQWDQHRNETALAFFHLEDTTKQQQGRAEAWDAQWEHLRKVLHKVQAMDFSRGPDPLAGHLTYG